MVRILVKFYFSIFLVDNAYASVLVNQSLRVSRGVISKIHNRLVKRLHRFNTSTSANVFVLKMIFLYVFWF